MKKNLFFLFLFSVFFIPFNCFALSFDINDTTITVNDTETLRDFCYYKWIKDSSYNKLIVYSIDDVDMGYQAYGCTPLINNVPYYENNNFLPSNFHSNALEVPDDFVMNNNNATLYDTDFNTWYSSGSITVVYSSIDLYNSSGNNITFQSNFTFQNIEDKYNPQVEPEEPEPEEPDDSSQITTNDFYILLLLLSVLIWLLYFKWCFPNSGGGRDLR